MNTHTDHLDAQEALPWLANGTLAGAELERVQAHIATCAQCRADLALLRTVHAAGPGPDLDFDPDRALARLMPQLDAPPVQARTGLLQRWRDRAAANDRTWLRAAVAFQFGVTFRPDTPEAELRRIVRASGARIVGGPTVTDAWLVGADGRLDPVLARLRAEPAVTLAEPLSVDKQP